MAEWFPAEALRTLTASRGTILMAKLFGTKETHRSGDGVVTLHTYNGRRYLTGYKRTAEGAKT